MCCLLRAEDAVMTRQCCHVVSCVKYHTTITSGSSASVTFSEMYTQYKIVVKEYSQYFSLFKFELYLYILLYIFWTVTVALVFIIFIQKPPEL